MLLVPFVGGPASGKTSTMERLKTRVTAEYAPHIHWIPEIFGLLFEGMPKELYRDILAQEKALVRQWVISKVELLLYNRMRELADEDAIIFTDRGFFDMEAYCSPAECDLMLAAIPEADIWRHDFCVLFESTDSTANLENDRGTLRIEGSQSQRMRLADKTRIAWEKCTPPERLLVIPQCATIDEKAALTAKRLNEAIGKPVFNR